MSRLNSSLFRQGKGICVSLLLGVVFSYVLSPYLDNDCFSSFDRDSLINLRETLNSGSFKKDDYEPKFNFAGKPLKAKKTPQNLVRPRYFSSELGIRDRLLVAVLTDEKSVRDLAVAINQTSTHVVDKILFFIDAAGAEKANVVSLKLQGIVGFIDTKEILKPFHTLKYLIENFLDDYDFFLLIRDTTYLNSRKLNSVLSKVSVSEDLHVGGIRASRGSSFCSLDGGVLLSNSYLKKVSQYLDWCVKNAYSDSDDDNLGRCILHSTEAPCEQNILEVPFESVVLPKENQMELVSKDINEAITYSKIVDYNVMYKLHYQISKKRLVDNRKALRELSESSSTEGEDVPPTPTVWPPGSYPPFPPETRFDLVRWHYFDLSNIYFPSNKLNIKPLSGADLQDIQNVVETSVSWLIDKHKGSISYRRLVNGYRRFDPSRGLDYILDFAFRDSTGKETIKRVEACKPLGRVEVLPVPYVTENSRVTILLPVHAETAQESMNFMKRYSQTFMQSSELTFLLLVLLYDPQLPGKGHSQDVFKEVKEMAQDLTFKHRKDFSKIAWLSIKVPRVGEERDPPLYDNLLYFAIVDLVMKKLLQESLLLFTDPYVHLKVDYINRVRMNTILGKLVFSPIPFSEYDPSVVEASTGEPATPPKEDLQIHKNTGHFNAHNIRHISFYTTDFFSARSKVLGYIPAVKYDRDIATMFKAWEDARSEGKDVVSSVLELMAVEGGQVSVLRAPEPALKLRHSDWRKCESLRVGEEAASCLAERSENTGTRSQLASAILKFNLTDIHGQSPAKTV